MRAPLDVVLVDSTGATSDAHVSGRCGDLSMGSTSPGGYASVALAFDEPILSDFLLSFDAVRVYDTRSAEQVGGGRLVEPAKSANQSGEVWQIQAIGEGPAHMQDVTVPRIYIETSLDGFDQTVRHNTAAQSQVTAVPGGSAVESAVVVALPGGTVIGNAFVGALYYRRLVDCGMELGGYGFTRTSGIGSANYQTQSAVLADDGTPALQIVSSANYATGTIAAGPFVVGTDWTTGSDTLRLGADKSAGGALTIVNDDTWTAFYNIYVRSRMVDETGANITNSAHANAYVLASDVVADLLGRDLPRFDGANATVDTTSHHIDQFAYLDGATPMQIVTDLLGLESGFTWHVWGINPDTDLYTFEWVSWPSTVRYEASVIDGFDSPAPTDDLYNEVNVRYRDAKGRTRWTTRTQTVDALGSLTRSKMEDLGDEPGSLANANRWGDRVLADHAAPPNAGTLTVARPIMDNTLGRLVYPWELRPGNLIRVRGVRPYVDSLNATDRDGVTVFRIVSTTYSDSAGAATLELDAYTSTEAREIARLANRRPRRR